MQIYKFYLKVILKRGCNIGYEYIKGAFISFICLFKKNICIFACSNVYYYKLFLYIRMETLLLIITFGVIALRILLIIAVIYLIFAVARSILRK